MECILHERWFDKQHILIEILKKMIIANKTDETHYISGFDLNWFIFYSTFVLLTSFYDIRFYVEIFFNCLTWVLAVILIHITRITGIRGWHEDVGEGRRVCRPVRTWSVILSWHSLTFFLILFALQIDSRLVISDYWNLMAS